MAFNTLGFALFFTTVFLFVHFGQAIAKRGTSLTMQRTRITLLFTASLIYYAMAAESVWKFLPLLIGVAAFGSHANQKIKQATGPRSRQLWFLAQIVPLLLILFAFKLKSGGADSEIKRTGLWLFPLGLSFYTFHGHRLGH